MPPAPTEAYFNPLVNSFLKTELPPVNTKGTMGVDKYDVMDLNLFLQGGTFYEYPGSLSSPPCAETVTWMVRREALPASHTQIRYLHDGIWGMTSAFGNARATMPVGSRSVYVRKAVKEEPPPPPPTDLNVPNPKGRALHTDSQFHAMKWAKDALRVAVASAGYVKDLDDRLRYAAIAHFNELQPYNDRSTTAAPPGWMFGGTTTPPMSDAEIMANKLAMSIKKVTQDAIRKASDEIVSTAKNSAVTAAQEAVKAAAQDIIPQQHPQGPPVGRQ
jgi:hypothetical protein